MSETQDHSRTEPDLTNDKQALLASGGLPPESSAANDNQIAIFAP